MDSLTKEQKDEYATSFAILALYDGGAEITSEQVTSLLQATGNDEVEAFYPIIFTNYLSDPEVLGKLITSPGGGGGGGGDAGGAGGDAAEEEKVEEKVEEEEEMDMAGGMDMFGGEEAGGSDY